MFVTSRRRLTAAMACLLAAMTSACASVERAAEAPTTRVASETAAGPRRQGSLLMAVPPPVPVAVAAPAVATSQPPAVVPMTFAKAPPAAPAATVVQPAPAAVAEPVKIANAASRPATRSETVRAEPLALAAPPAPVRTAVVSAPAAQPLGRPKPTTVRSAGDLGDHYRRRLAEQGGTLAAPAPAPVIEAAPQHAPVYAYVEPAPQPRPARRQAERSDTSDFRGLEDHYRRRLAQSGVVGLPGDAIAGASVMTHTD
jgi:hypothetical protein